MRWCHRVLLQALALAVAVVALLACTSGPLAATAAAATLSPDDAVAWRQGNTQFDWQTKPGEQIRIIGRGVEDRDGNLYFCGTKSYDDAVASNGDPSTTNSHDIFVARINADDSIGWTQE
ncbi:hypothetical protein PINS_up005462, partial [Pythium insidiosum]